jgi:hypothetical protein
MPGNLQVYRETLAHQIELAHDLYHRLVLLVAPAGAGKTAILIHFSEKAGLPYVNVNLEVSRRMLELTEKQRALRVGTVLGEIVDAAGGDIVILDNIELLFDQSLQQDPLRLLKELSRKRTVVASWNGSINESGLSYAVPGHPEYRRYARGDIDFLHVTIGGAES